MFNRRSNTTSVKSVAGRFGRVLLASTVASAALAALITTPAAAATPTRASIAKIANAELGGTQCNPVYPGIGSYLNSCGMEWCAEFARWVWKTAGVTELDGLDGWAESFRTYGKANDTYHAYGSYTPQPGDAILFENDFDSDDAHPIDHVAIVTGVSGGTVHWVGGNQGGGSGEVTTGSRKLSVDNGKIVGYATPVGVSGTAVNDIVRRIDDSVTGDGFTDLIGLTADGTMLMYSNNFIRDEGVPYSASREIGHGFNNFDTVVKADVTGDGFTDLVTRKTDGTLWLYANNYVRDGGVPYSAGVQIGSGWSNFDSIIGADINGDGYTDLVARHATSKSLYLYLNTKNVATPFNGGNSIIGTGWGNFDALTSADVNGDGYSDIVGRTTTGSLLLYPSRYATNATAPLAASSVIGTGWGNMNQIVGADVNGDGYTDLVARSATDNNLYLYANNIVKNDGTPYSANQQIGANWQNFSAIL